MKFSARFLAIGCLLLSMGGLAACSDDSDDNATEGGGGSSAMGGADSGGADAGGSTILELASSTDDLSSLVAAVEKAGLGDALAGDGLTVFAPTNEAFAQLLAAIGAESLDDVTAEQLVPILKYHVLAAEVDSTAATAVANGEGTAMSLGGSIDVTLDGDALKVDGATVTTADVEASNGVVHIIDQVILPSITDVVTTDEELSSLASTLVAVQGEEDLVSTFDGDGSFTLFAPTNAAFTAVESVTSTLETSEIVAVLQYHALGTQVLSTDITMPLMPVTVLGPAVDVTPMDGMVMVGSGGAKVTRPDILTANGVIHVIDGVLIPPQG